MVQRQLADLLDNRQFKNRIMSNQTTNAMFEVLISLAENLRGGDVLRSTFLQMQVRQDLLVLGHLMIDIVNQNPNLENNAIELLTAASANAEKHKTKYVGLKSEYAALH